MTAIELLRQLEKNTNDESWGGTILYWARRHLETHSTGQDIRFGSPGSVYCWLREREFWDGKELEDGQAAERIPG